MIAAGEEDDAPHVSTAGLELDRRLIPAGRPAAVRTRAARQPLNMLREKKGSLNRTSLQARILLLARCRAPLADESRQAGRQHHWPFRTYI
jgi:hypothetical protein